MKSFILAFATGLLLASAPIASATANVETNISVTTSTGSTNTESRTTTKQVIRNGNVIVNESSTTNATAKPEAVRKELKEIRDKAKAEMQSMRQTFRSERAKMHGERLQRRFAWYYERLSDIAVRTQTRIDVEKAEGKNTASAQASLNTGKATLETAKTDGEKAVSMFAALTVDTWDMQKPEVKAAIDQANTARKGFADAKKSMMDAVRALAEN